MYNFHSQKTVFGEIGIDGDLVRKIVVEEHNLGLVLRRYMNRMEDLVVEVRIKLRVAITIIAQILPNPYVA